MKGRDGVAEHDFVQFETILAALTVLPAAGVGRHWVVFRIGGSVSVASQVTFTDAAAVVLWRSGGQAANFWMYDYDAYGLFRTPDNSSLLFAGGAGVAQRFNLTFENRPTEL